MTPKIDLKEQVLMALDESLKAELTAVHQYLLHAKMCRNWGYERLAELNRKEALDEFGHAELLIDRILFLKGNPNMADLFPITASSNVKEQLECSFGSRSEGGRETQCSGEDRHRRSRQRFAPTV